MYYINRSISCSCTKKPVKDWLIPIIRIRHVNLNAASSVSANYRIWLITLFPESQEDIEVLRELAHLQGIPVPYLYGKVGVGGTSSSPFKTYLKIKN